MVDYTTPLTTTFELQRKTLSQGQRAIEGSLEFQKEMTGAALDTLEVHESSQRQAVEFLQDSFHRTLDAAEGLPGAASMTEEVRTTVDEQYDELLAAHEDAFDTIESELDDGFESYDEMTVEYLDTLDEQLDMLLEAHEDLEEQSVEATEQVSEQVEDLQEQVEDVQEQIQDVSEQAADAVEA
jgi:gas vesicle protein